jgi:hypothetical protein
MKQFYAEFIYWEDYINDMYDLPEKEDEEEYVLSAIKMLSDTDLFLETCKEVLINWTISSKVNLTNTGCNRKAWLGQATCSYKYKVPEVCTRIAWSRLTIEQQDSANRIAEKIIKSFELNYEKKDTELY